VDWQECRRWRERKDPASKALHGFTWVIAVTRVLQGGLFIYNSWNPKWKTIFSCQRV